VIYYGAEICWRERHARMSAVLDATPVRGSAMIASKWTALAAIVGALVTGGIVAGIGLQVSRGYWDFEPELYLATFYLAGLPLALFAAVAVFVHALSPGKYAGMVLVLVVAIFTQRAYLLGLEHHLWRFASAPPVGYTEMNGFGAQLAAFHWYMLLWSAVGALLMLLAAGLWRGMGSGAGERVGRLLRPSPAGRSVAAALAGVAVATGCWIFYNTDVLNARTTSEELLDWKADYERAYRPIAGLPQPAIADVEADVALYPEERRYRVAGRYTLVNDTSSPIGTVLVAVRREAGSVALSLASARLVETDDRFGMHRFELDEPLAPGARADLHFDLGFESRGFVDGAADDTVVENGSFVMSLRCFPTVGYRKSYEIVDARERQRRGLAGPSVAPLETGDLGARDGEHGDERVGFAATVSTSGDQLVVAPGRLERTWEQDGRRYFRFRAERPILNRFVVASARYEVAARRVGDVEVEVYYDPRHGANVERMLDAAATTLAYCEEQFGPYPHRELRIAEIPASWGFAGLAMPGTIFLGETRGFLVDARAPGPVDLVLRRVAHEVAHQWWGHGLAPASAEGATAIVESLTKYTELMVTERLHGRDRVREQLELELDRYLAGRSREEREEVPLYRAGDQPYLYYAKGALVLYAIRGLIGEAAVGDALRGLVAEYGEAPGRATTLDLLSHLRRVAPEGDVALIEEWMKEIVLYDLKAESASVVRRDDGRYEVRVRVAAARSRADGRGVESPMPLRERIEVRVVGEGSTLSSERYELRDGANELSIVVDEVPAAVEVDPYLSRIDKNRFDNRIALNGRPTAMPTAAGTARNRER
jgi:ABC-2 type transport system permease protein